MHSCSRFVCSDCAHSRAQRSFVPRLLSAVSTFFLSCWTERCCWVNQPGRSASGGVRPSWRRLVVGWAPSGEGRGGPVCGTAVCDVAIPQLTLKSSCGGLRAALSPGPQKWTFLLRHGERCVGLQKARPAASAQAASGDARSSHVPTGEADWICSFKKIHLMEQNMRY